MIYALHGTLGSPADWEPLGLNGVQSVDLWTKTSPLTTFADSIDTGRDSKPILLGYSMGGRLALHAMAACPERWAGAIIISAHPGLENERDRVARRAADVLWANKARTLSWVDFLTEWNSQPVLAGQPASPSQAHLESQRAAVASSFETWSLGKQESLSNQLMNCEFPVLWVTGAEDSKFTAIGHQMAAVFPDFEHQILLNCGHRVIFEAPVETGRCIADFIARRIDCDYRRPEKSMNEKLSSGTYQANDANLEGSTFTNVKLEGAIFNDVNLKKTHLEDVALTGATIRNACLSDLSIEDANYAGMRIEGVLVSELLSFYREANKEGEPSVGSADQP